MADIPVGSASVEIIADANLRQFEQQAGRAANTFEQRLNQDINRALRNQRGFREFETNARRATDRVNESLGRTSGQLDLIRRNLQRLGIIFGLTFAVRAVGNIIDTAASFELLTVGLENVTGSAEAAADAIDRIRQLSLESGFAVDQLGSRFQQLIALGFDIDETNVILEKFQDAVLASGGSVNEFNRAFLGFIQNAGRGTASLEEFRQITESIPASGPRIRRALAENLAIPITQVDKAFSQGAISSEVFTAAVIEGLGSIPGAADAAERRLGTLRGAIDALRQRLNFAIIDGAAPLADAIRETLIPNLDEFQEVLDEVFEDIGVLLTNGFEVMFDLFEDLTPAILSLTGSFANLSESFGTVATLLGGALIPLLERFASVIQTLTNLPGFNALLGIGITFAVASRLARAALTALSASLGRLQVSLNGVAAGATRASTNIRTLQTSAAGAAVGIRGASSAVGLLGRTLGRLAGPAGLALTAFSVFSALRGGAEEADEAFIDFNRTLLDTSENIEKAFGLGAEALAQGINQLVSEINRLESGDTLNQLAGEALRESLFETGDAITKFTDILDQGAFDSAEAFIDQLERAGTATDFIDFLNRRLEEAKEAHLDAEEAARRNENALNGLTNITQTAAEAFASINEALQDFTDSINPVIAAEERLSRAIERAGDARQDVIDAERELQQFLEDGLAGFDAYTNALRRHEDALEAVTEATLELEEAQTPATADDLEEATDRVLRARIALARANREAVRSEEELAGIQRQVVNLAGLSVDQVRTRLSNLRATIAAQRRTSNITEDAAKTEEEVEEEALERQLDQRAAARELREAEEDLTETKLKGTDADEDVVDARKAVERANRDLKDSIDDLRDAEEEFQRRRGDLEDNVTDAREEQVRLSEDIRELDLAHQEALAVFLEDEEEINRILRERLSLNADLIAQNPARARAFVEAVTGGIDFLQGPGIATIQEIARALLQDPTSDFRLIFRRLGIPGFAQGGIVTNHTLAQLGEGGRAEAVLPLTRPARLQELLATPQVLNPVLSALGRITLPQATSNAPRVHNIGSGSSAVKDGPMTSRQADRLIDLLENSKREVHVEAPVQIMGSVDDPNVLARKVKRQVERTIEGLL